MTDEGEANWESVEGKPDVLIYKEGKAYKVTVFKRKGLGRELKPQTYLLQMENRRQAESHRARSNGRGAKEEGEANGNLFMNTGFRIDVAYNEETDVLTLASPSSSSLGMAGAGGSALRSLVRRFSPNGDYVRVKATKDNLSQ